MLQFVLGRAKSGRSTRLISKIKELATLNKKIIFIVPEQYSYETEKNLYKEMGIKLFKSVEVLGFSRLATEIFKSFGGVSGEYASDQSKLIIMEQAIENLKDNLEVYKKSSGAKTFPKIILEIVKEFKNAGLTPDFILEKSEEIEDGYFKDKLQELTLIYNAYDALLSSSYLDSLDDISRAVALAKGKGFFADTYVFVDEFDGFTQTEFSMLSLILEEAKELTVSLCLDLELANENEFSHFENVRKTYSKLFTLAKERNIAVLPSVKLTASQLKGDLSHLEKNLFADEIKPFGEKTEGINLLLFKNEYEEADYVSSKIFDLVSKENLSYRDIAVLSRDLTPYQSRLESNFTALNIPYYLDKLYPVAEKPLIRFVVNALSAVQGSFKSENILNLLKCGLTRFETAEISMLENYVFVWGINGAEWEEDFVSNPKGYKQGFSNQESEDLDKINEIRKYVITALSRFKNNVREKNGEEISKAVFTMLSDFGIKENTEKIIAGLVEKGDFLSAEDYKNVWECLMNLLNTTAVVLKDVSLSPKRYEKLFSLAVSETSIGKLPLTIDCVHVGSAERVRLGEKKAVFVLGANEGVFPLNPDDGGVFTNRERERLSELEINLSKPQLEQYNEERFIAYKTLTSSSEKLFITARKADVSGKQILPSELFFDISKMFSLEIAGSDDITPDFYCKNQSQSFNTLAKIYREDTPLSSAVIEALKSDSVYREKLSELERVYKKEPFEIRNRQNAEGIFSKVMEISPTRVESFYKCHFKYFCEHGLRVLPLRKADLDPMETGTLIHDVLFSVTQKVNLSKSYDEKLVRKMVKEHLDNYIEQVMGGAKTKSKRFIYLYNRLCLSILKIIKKLHEELSESGFYPCDFEYEITDQSEITPLKIVGDDETVVKISGKIDRVDKYISKKGEKYIRIVDYKSGRKEFKLNDILYGMNLQMLIYLYCVKENGSGKYENSIPAGILYMPAGESMPSLSRNATAEEIEKEKSAAYKMNGLILDNPEILEAMEPKMQGLVIPVKKNKDGSISKSTADSLISLEGLAKINRYIDKLVLNMAAELHCGKIEAYPIEETCGYCDYRGVCGITKASLVKSPKSHKAEEILAEMEKEDICREY